MLNHKYSIPILITILACIALIFTYKSFVAPKKTAILSNRAIVNQLEQDQRSLYEDIRLLEEEKRETASLLYEFQKKIPPSRELKDLILKIEELELIAEARVHSVSFNHYDTSVSESAIQQSNELGLQEDGEELEQELDQKLNTEEANEDSTEKDELPVTTISKDSLPKELQLITLTIDLSIKDEEQLILYLQELEAVERIIKIDRIDTKVPGEEEQMDLDTDGFIQTVLQITTFYYDGV